MSAIETLLDLYGETEVLSYADRRLKWVTLGKAKNNLGIVIQVLFGVSSKKRTVSFIEVLRTVNLRNPTIVRLTAISKQGDLIICTAPVTGIKNLPRLVLRVANYE